MRIRSIKPEFFKDEELADLDPLTRLFFIGLWCSADANGILENRPKRLAVEILPYDSLGEQRGNNWETPSVDLMLTQLQAGKWIGFFEDGGKKYIAIRNWHRHQRITGKEATGGGKYPTPTDDFWEGNNGEATGKHPDAQEQGTGSREQGTRIKEQGKDFMPISKKSPHDKISKDAFLEIWKAFLPFNRQGDSRKVGFDKYIKARKAGFSDDQIKTALRELARLNKARAFGGEDKGFSTWLWPENIEAALEGEQNQAKQAPAGKSLMEQYFGRKPESERFIDAIVTTEEEANLLEN